ELGALAQSFNDMADRLKTSFDDLVGEVDVRKSGERELRESAARLLVSEERLQLALDAAKLAIWDWDVKQDRLGGDDSMYQLYCLRKGAFSGPSTEEQTGALRICMQLALDAAKLAIWDWDVKQDRLVWDDSMYQLYGLRKDEFSGALDAWTRRLAPEDVARATGDIEAALRGEREFRSDFRIRRPDGSVCVIRGLA